MPAYPDPPSENNPTAARTQATQPTLIGEHILAELRAITVTKAPTGHRAYNIEAWVTTGLAAIEPWVWGIRSRLDRTHHRNTQGYVNGVHCKERGAREAELDRDMDLLKRRAFYTRTERLPGLLQLKALKIIGALHRLLDETTWWKPHTYFDGRERRLVERTYLPEDTWSVQTCVHWCVEHLEQLFHAAGGIRSTGGRWVGGKAPHALEPAPSSAENSTPPLMPFTPPIRRVFPPSAKNEEAWLAEITRRGEQRTRGEPVTWSTT